MILRLILIKMSTSGPGVPSGAMKERASSAHRLTPLIQTPLVRIDRCSCGTMHLRIGGQLLKLCPAQFHQVAAAIGIVGEPLHPQRLN